MSTKAAFDGTNDRCYDAKTDGAANNEDNRSCVHFTMGPLFFSRQTVNIPPEIVYLSRENVVMHVSTTPKLTRSFLRAALGQKLVDSSDAAASITKTGDLPLSTFTIADHDSPFAHMRITTPDDGKVMFVAFSLLWL